MILRNVRSKHSLVSGSGREDLGGERWLGEREQGVVLWHWATEGLAELPVGRWSCPGIVCLTLIRGTASRLVAFCPCLVFPQTISVWVSCRRGSGKTGIVLSLLSPESEWGGLRVQTGEQVLVLPVAQMACTSSPPGGSLWHRCLWGQQEPPLGRETAQFGLKVEGRAGEDQLVWWK